MLSYLQFAAEYKFAVDISNDVDCFATDNNERKPYFEPREAKPDHPVIKRAAPAAVAVNQVVPPDIQDGFDSPQVSSKHCLWFCVVFVAVVC